MYLSLEKSEANLEFWRSLLIVSSASLEALRDERAIGVSAYLAQTQANQTVKGEITRLLQGKSYDQLVALQQQVQRKLTSGEPVDVEYWESLLKELIVWKAKAKLRDMHEVVLANRLEQLRKKQRDEALKTKEEVRNALGRSGIQPAPANAEEDEQGEGEGDMDLDHLEQAPPEEIVAEPWDESLEPPKIKKIGEELRSCEIVDPELEKQKLVCWVNIDSPRQARTHLFPRFQYEARRKVLGTRFVTKARPLSDVAATNARGDNKDEEIYQAAVGQGLDEEEELFNLEVEMSRPSSYSWEDKYRPRKPRYFNKVHTGYEWNKYNQTHYE